MADDREDLFGDLGEFDDLGKLDETPDFPLGDEPMEFPPPQEEGISRTFKIVGALIGIAVVAIVVLLVLFAIQSGDELTDTEKQSTEIAGTNVALEGQYNATLTALAKIEEATQTQVRIDEVTATALFNDQQTQEAVRATSQAETATAEALANQTAVAQTSTQEAIDQSMTATVQAERRVRIRVVDPQGNALDNVTLRLYRDDGDGVFTPADRIGGPLNDESASGGETTGGESGEPTETQAIDYGEIAEGTLALGEVDEWTFTGAQGDSVIINAIAGDPVQMDMFMELYGPDDSLLQGDDDSGDASNASITFSLPQDGKYSIRVSSVTGPGSYTLVLSLSFPAAPESQPSGDTTSPESPFAEPTQEGATGWRVVPAGDDSLALVGYTRSGAPDVFLRQGTPTPIPDDLIDEIISATEGLFDFGELEPGIYWVELDYATLPPELQALVPPGEPLVFKLIVPIGGEFTIELGGPTPTPGAAATPTPEVNDIQLTATAFARQTASPQPTFDVGVTTLTPTIDTDIVTLTPTSEPGDLTATLPNTGFFSDISDDGVGGTSGLAVLAVAAAGLVAVVFIARKLRTSA